MHMHITKSREEREQGSGDLWGCGEYSRGRGAT